MRDGCGVEQCLHSDVGTVRSSVRLNSGGVQELLDGAVGQAVCEPVAQRVLAAAQAGAPVESGDYRSSLRIEVDHTDRVRVSVVADVPHALAVEARTGNLVQALGGGSGVASAVERVSYTTRDGRTIMATRAQVANWTRGAR